MCGVPHGNGGGGDLAPPPGADQLVQGAALPRPNRPPQPRGHAGLHAHQEEDQAGEEGEFLFFIFQHDVTGGKFPFHAWDNVVFYVRTVVRISHVWAPIYLDYSMATSKKIGALSIKPIRVSPLGPTPFLTIIIVWIGY